MPDMQLATAPEDIEWRANFILPGPMHVWVR
jgi:hypothetical protein